MSGFQALRTWPVGAAIMPVQAWGHSPVEILEACAGLRVWPSGDHESLWLAAWQFLGSWPRRVVIMQACAALRGMAQCSGYHASLCRPGGGCGSLAWQALEAQACRVEIVQACTGLRMWPGGDRECLWIPCLAGVNSSFGRDCLVLRAGCLG
jgi:hypothetical protein